MYLNVLTGWLRDWAVALTLVRCTAWQLLDRNCWPDFSAHYASCCQEAVPCSFVPRCAVWKLLYVLDCFVEPKSRTQLLIHSHFLLLRKQMFLFYCIILSFLVGPPRLLICLAFIFSPLAVWQGIPPSPQCFDESRTFEKCCRCQNGAELSLGHRLTQQFFGPLLCHPSVATHEDDFWIQHKGKRRLLRIFMYPLPRMFNADLLNRLQLGGWMDGSECDYGLTACTESKWNGLFSVYRQFATEILVLMKFLAAPEGVLTEDPEEADLFVVPYFAKTDCAESGNAGRDPCWGKCKCATVVKHLFSALPHFSWHTRGRHLFLATGDIKDLPVEIQSQPPLLSLGASFCGGHVVVPSPNLDPDLQPGGKMETKEAADRAPERHILAFWFGSIDKIWRKRVVSQMQKYQKYQEQQEQQTGFTRPVVIHGIDGDYVARDIWQTTASSPQMVLEEMMRLGGWAN